MSLNSLLANGENVSFKMGKEPWCVFPTAAVPRILSKQRKPKQQFPHGHSLVALASSFPEWRSIQMGKKRPHGQFIVSELGQPPHAATLKYNGLQSQTIIANEWSLTPTQKKSTYLPVERVY